MKGFGKFCASVIVDCVSTFLKKEKEEQAAEVEQVEEIKEESPSIDIAEEIKAGLELAEEQPSAPPLNNDGTYVVYMQWPMDAGSFVRVRGKDGALKLSGIDGCMGTELNDGKPQHNSTDEKDNEKCKRIPQCVLKAPVARIVTKEDSASLAGKDIMKERGIRVEFGHHDIHMDVNETALGDGAEAGEEIAYKQDEGAGQKEASFLQPSKPDRDEEEILSSLFKLGESSHKDSYDGEIIDKGEKFASLHFNKEHLAAGA